MDEQNSVEAAARQWVLYLHSGAVDVGRLADFEAWVGADLAHARAYRDYEQLMGDLTLVDELADIEITPATETPAPPVALRARPAMVRRMLAPVAAIAATLVIALMLTTQLGAPDFETQVAQVRNITLSDGSSVTLGGRSKIETDFSETVRRVTLLEGEAFFDVVTDPGRPFHVVVGDRLVRVVGTKFDVRHGLERVHVAVLEGVVEVLQADAAEQIQQPPPVAATQVLRAGEQVVALIGTAEQTRTAVEPSEAGAWRRGWLSYENASLAEIVSDANRYNERQIVFASEEVKDIRVTAAFGADAVDQFISGLTASHPIQADYSQRGQVVLRSFE